MDFPYFFWEWGNVGRGGGIRYVYVYVSLRLFGDYLALVLRAYALDKYQLDLYLYCLFCGCLSFTLFLFSSPTPYTAPFAAGFYDCLRCQQLCSLGLSKLLCHVCQILCHACSQHSTVRACVCVCVRVLHATFVHMMPHTVVATSASAAAACGRHYYGWDLAVLPLLHLFVNLKRPSKHKERERERGRAACCILQVALKAAMH